MTTLERLFGTDGIRGVFGTYPLVAETVTALGYELAATLREASGAPGHRPRLELAGDSRDSTPQISRWLLTGLEAGGAEVRYGGVLPTPAVAHLVRRRGADAGIAVSASHNLHPDNGIKLVDGEGFKWSEAAEGALERRLAHSGVRQAAAEGPLPEPDPGAAEEYLAILRASLPAGRPLAGLRLALDAAHGAASAFAGPVFEEMGAEVTLLHAEPDGRNINRDSGSTHPQALQALLAKGGFDLGLAFDGDADRALLVDEQGELRDGDAMLYLWGAHLLAEGSLEPPRLVATTMSNLGLERSLADLGIGLVRCGVGDRHVVETLRREGLLLGGEQSGHLVHLGLASTGDGLMTALQLAWIVARAGRPVSDLLAPFRRFPQVLLNVRVARKQPFEQVPTVAAAAAEVERKLSTEGRLLLRYSGTEPVARVMIEGPEQALIEDLAQRLAAEIRTALG